MTTTAGRPPWASGQASPARRGRVATFGVGRVCAHPGCSTTLSRYNSSDVCWSHVEGSRSSDPRPER